MAGMTHNHDNYQAYLRFMQRRLQNRLHLTFKVVPSNLENADIILCQYDPGSPFKYKSFFYRVSLPAPVIPDQTAANESLQPGCIAIALGTHQFILRLSNPLAEGMNQNAPFENEVAVITRLQYPR
ncbi:hypothetical protein BJX76DRAFT_357453 [Aspergillus varians]